MTGDVRSWADFEANLGELSLAIVGNVFIHALDHLIAVSGL